MNKRTMKAYPVVKNVPEALLLLASGTGVGVDLRGQTAAEVEVAKAAMMDFLVVRNRGIHDHGKRTD